MDARCPRCDSPAPHLHPAMQSEGEVQPCSHPWHNQPTNRTRQDIGEVLDRALPGGLTGLGPLDWLEGSCPVCQGRDVKDLGWVMEVHVLICKSCGNYLAREISVTLISDPKILAAIDVEGTP